MASSKELGFPSKAERLLKIRNEKLVEMALQLLSDLKGACKAAHVLNKRTLTWGAILPTIMVGADEDMDEVLRVFSKLASEGSFTKIEWCKAAAPAAWQDEPVRFGSHIHMRVDWGDDADVFFG
eukprot:TRINITY_DN21252_c0_g1_i1.p3 TRINITY_DN21252_c0_g1~~TRINITY_DN21252_c0_g1_i1.p3  ORF type:complete len:124 (+),score=40.34 TRINITY_DN21252_c0_g1_i1:77-448(+)